MRRLLPRLVLAFLAGAVLVSPALPALAAQGAKGKSESPVLDVSEVLAAIRKKHDVPALAAVTIEGGRVTAAGTDGVRKRGAEAKVTIDDRFHLGSCTKSMTATMIATLVEERKLSWDTTIGDVFGDLGKKMRPEWKPVTLEQLLTHRSGAPGDVPPELWSQLWKREGTPTAQRIELVRGTLANEPEEVPGTKFIYSNTGYAIAGAMAEKVTGKAWEDLMRERLFTPLGMKSAGFGAPGKAGKLDEPLGHKKDGTPRELGPSDDNPPAIGPAGTVHATLENWAKYVAAHLTRDAKLLKPETFAKLHEPAQGEGKEYAMGWGVAERDWGGGRVLTHSGSNTMWYCTVKMAPKKDFAVLLATNQGGDDAKEACDEAANAMIEVVLGRREAEKR
ncbi:MAG: serine hydrolase domain-containing protein [Planctomycetota bacterium]